MFPHFSPTFSQGFPTVSHLDEDVGGSKALGRGLRRSWRLWVPWATISQYFLCIPPLHPTSYPIYIWLGMFQWYSYYNTHNGYISVWLVLQVCFNQWMRDIYIYTHIINANPGLIDPGLLIRGTPPIVIIWYLNSTLPIKQSRGLLIQGWHYIYICHNMYIYIYTWYQQTTKDFPIVTSTQYPWHILFHYAPTKSRTLQEGPLPNDGQVGFITRLTYQYQWSVQNRPHEACIRLIYLHPWHLQVEVEK